jgi:dephospho-CoA kinase
MIYGITGTIGAGKGTVVQYFVQEKGFKHYSVREFLSEEIRKRGVVEDRNSFREVANELRKTHTPAYIIEKLYARAIESEGCAIIDSIRALGEAIFLKDNGVKIIAVDADREIRYERIRTRASVTDHVDFKTFVLQEDRELRAEEAHDMNIRGVMKMADFHIKNNGTVKDLYKSISEVV